MEYKAKDTSNNKDQDEEKNPASNWQFDARFFVAMAQMPGSSTRPSTAPCHSFEEPTPTGSHWHSFDSWQFF